MFLLKTTSLALLTFTLFSTPLLAAEDIQMIGNFSANDTQGWKEKVFKNKTIYKLIASDHGTVLQAKSQSSASAFYKDVKIDLVKTPCLNWSWNVDHVLKGLNEKTKSGDDFAARIYVVFSGGIAFWNTKGLNYVWSGSTAAETPIGTAWPNAYTENSINIALQNGSSRIGQWVFEHRNVLLDAQTHLQKDLKTADGIAIMVDTDDSQSSATASFGDLYFSNSC